MNTNLYIELLEKEVMELRQKASRRHSLDKIPVDLTNIHTREGATAATNIMDVTNDAMTKLSEQPHG